MGPEPPTSTQTYTAGSRFSSQSANVTIRAKANGVGGAPTLPSLGYGAGPRCRLDATKTGGSSLCPALPT